MLRPCLRIGQRPILSQWKYPRYNDGFIIVVLVMNGDVKLPFL